MVKELIEKGKLLALTAMFLASNPMLVLAGEDAEADVSYLIAEGNGAFDGVQEAAKGTLASIYQLVFVISTGILVIAVVLAFMKLGLFKGQEREKQKGAIGWLIVSIIGVTSAVSIFTMIAGVSQGMF